MDIIISIITGIVTSLLVGFYVNLNTSKLQKWLEKRNRKKVSKKQAKLAKAYEQAKRFSNDRGEYREHLLMTVINALLTLIIGGIITAMFLYAARQGVGDSRIDKFMSELFGTYLSFFIMLFSMLFAGTRLLDATILHIRVTDFKSFEEDVLKTHPDLKK